MTLNKSLSDTKIQIYTNKIARIQNLHTNPRLLQL